LGFAEVDVNVRAIAEAIAKFEHNTGPKQHSDDDGAVWPVPRWDELGTDTRERLVRLAMPLAETVFQSTAESGERPTKEGT
jgi:hypothetical protein